MRNYRNQIILSLIILFVMLPNNIEAKNDGFEIVFKLSSENITLYAKKFGSLYRDFKIDFKGETYFRPFWMNDTNPAYAPQIYYEDINKDEKNELIITLTKGYGTGVLDEEVYVYSYSNGLIDISVDNPMAIINKNVKTKLSDERAEVIIDGKKCSIDITPLEIKPENLFDDIGFESIINYNVEDNHLVVSVSGQISPASFVGSIVIVYEFRDKMYQVKLIEFIPCK